MGLFDNLSAAARRKEFTKAERSAASCSAAASDGHISDEEARPGDPHRPDEAVQQLHQGQVQRMMTIC